jgi:hypothetical protein
VHPPRKAKPFRCRTRSRVAPISRASLAMPLHVTTTKNFASNCDPKAGRDSGCRQPARFASLGSACQERSFPLAEHTSASQSSSRLHIIVEGVSH